MDKVQKFISENSHQFGYIMQEASRQWVAKDPDGALTVGTCKSFVDRYGDYHTILDKLKVIEEAKAPKKDVYKAIVSGHIYNTGLGSADIEILTHVSNDTDDGEVYAGLEFELVDELEHHLEKKDDHFFAAIVYARCTSWQSQEGTEYAIEYDIHEINRIEDLDKGADF